MCAERSGKTSKEEKNWRTAIYSTMPVIQQLAKIDKLFVRHWILFSTAQGTPFAQIPTVCPGFPRTSQLTEIPPRFLTWMHYSLDHQFSSVAQSCLTLCDPMDHSTPGLPVHHQLPEFTQTHVHWVRDAIQPSHPLSSPSPPAFSLSQCQGLFQWVSSSHLVVKVLEFQLQHQSFQWIFRTDLL